MTAAVAVGDAVKIAVGVEHDQAVLRIQVGIHAAEEVAGRAA